MIKTIYGLWHFLGERDWDHCLQLIKQLIKCGSQGCNIEKQNVENKNAKIWNKNNKILKGL